MVDLLPVSDEGQASLPNGCTLYWKTDHSIGGAREYVSDEIGGGVMVWNTALVDETTLLAAIVQEAALRTIERVNGERVAAEVAKTATESPSD